MDAFLTHFPVDLGALLPPVYAGYRPVLEEGVHFFLRGLPTARLMRALFQQEQLTAHTSPLHRIPAWLTCFPTLHKLGQMVCRDARLDPSLRSSLQTLETMPATTSLASIKDVVHQELAEFKLELGSPMLAEGSVAVVIRFSFQDREQGVLKVLKPRVREHLAQELEIWVALGRFVDERCDHYKLPALNCSALFEEIAALLSSEVCFDQEQAHMRTAREFFASDSRVHIPALLPFCTPQITAMERIEGLSLRDLPQARTALRSRLADTISASLIAGPMFRSTPTPLFHGDPHGGNLFSSREEKLAVLDWSLAGSLSAAERTHFAQIMLGAFTFDTRRIMNGIASLASNTPDETALRAVVEQAVSRLSVATIPSVLWLQTLLDGAALRGRTNFAPNLLLLRKAMYTLEGVIRGLDPGYSVDRMVLFSAWKSLWRDWPSRLFTDPARRDFDLPLSMLDILMPQYTLPATAAAFWFYRLQDWLNPVGRSSGEDQVP